MLRKKAEEAGFSDSITVDSCGTGDWHVGDDPDERSQANALKNGLDISMLRGRQITVNDLDEFDRLYVMDSSNHQNVMALTKTAEQKAKIDFLLNASKPGSNMAVPDPYFGGVQGFQDVFELVEDACLAIVNELKL